MSGEVYIVESKLIAKFKLYSEATRQLVIGSRLKDVA